MRGEGGGRRVRHTRERRGPGRGASAVARSRDRTLRLAPCLGLVLLPLGLQSCLGLRLRLRNALPARGLLRLPGGALRGGLAGSPSLALGVASRVLGALLGGGGGVPADACELARERRRHGVARARRVHAEEVRLSAQEAEHDVCAIDRRGDGRRSGCAIGGARECASGHRRGPRQGEWVGVGVGVGPCGGVASPHLGGGGGRQDVPGAAARASRAPVLRECGSV